MHTLLQDQQLQYNSIFLHWRIQREFDKLDGDFPPRMPSADVQR